MMSEVHLIYTTFGSKEEAVKVAGQLINEKLIACANILSPATSIYEWQGRNETSEEFPTLLKTTGFHVKNLETRLTELHSYECPCFLEIQVDGASLFYEQWVQSQTVKN